MNINSSLNFVFPIRYAEDGSALIYAYSMPISTEVFTANYRIIRGANAKIWQHGTDYAAASANTAHLTLLDVAAKDAEEYGLPESLGPAFLAEIKRLSYILAPGSNTGGYDQIPIDVAISRKIIDTDEWEESLSFIVFFTLRHTILPRAIRKELCLQLASAMNGWTTSLFPLDWIASLRQSTQVNDSIEILSSEPS